jgi:hypothetical protein
MDRIAKRNWQAWMLLGGLVLSATGSGCLQTTVAGQTLPSAYYLNDDVQYFPAGPETRLYNQVQALERYKLERQTMTSESGRTR